MTSRPQARLEGTASFAGQHHGRVSAYILDRAYPGVRSPHTAVGMVSFRSLLKSWSPSNPIWGGLVKARECLPRSIRFEDGDGTEARSGESDVTRREINSLSHLMFRCRTSPWVETWYRSLVSIVIVRRPAQDIQSEIGPHTPSIPLQPDRR